MRTFHLKRGSKHCSTVNVDKLWSFLPEGVYDKTKASGNTDNVPVLDTTKLVSIINACKHVS